MSKHQLFEKLLADLSLEPSQLVRIVARAPRTYKVYTIPKKSGGRRVIAQPARETKYVQAWLIESLFSKLPVHPSAAAYVKGSSIKKNALMHAGNPYIVKLDFENFFSSVRAEDVRQHLQRNFKTLTDTELDYISRIVCIKDTDKLVLSVGSPASPVLTNSIMYEFDDVVSKWAQENGFIYSRYADDLTFSTSTRGASANVELMVRDTLSRLAYPQLSLNTEKTIHLSKKGRRQITGLIITNSGTVSIGRDRKREISSMIHKFSLGSLPDQEIFRLQGLLGFVCDAEPLFLGRLRAKYGNDVLAALLQKRSPPKPVESDC
jgi:retron-type reverse transcriptase